NELKFRQFTPGDNEMMEFLSNKNTTALRDRVSLWELLRRPELGIQDYVEIGWLRDNDSDILEQLEIQAKYEGYIEKQKEQVKRFEKLENKQIPPDLNYDEVYGLSKEAVQKLSMILPASVGQASRIAGVNPADINVLLIFLEKKRRK
ncbi:MAG: tRNA uridine-5-carboxymethylaminomethyl(34) synthesis enzyme MnmG, partial [Syntrophomonas sp.]|nr:tRNA uridine-5-carboxymethylaminomethyl(34) synthesis enzyme MnmG [Syntrophomonas sp.]MDD4626308.1 tRNA uridine-5-carboxymethylaminomethyl(34) synthesis enzyme MnmG [Syntrophomonas sp.]